MTTPRSFQLAKIASLQKLLIEASRDWASGGKSDFEKAKKLRERVICCIHSYGFENIPFYRKLSHEENVAGEADISEIKHKLMLPDGVFKSYSSSWLDEGNFKKMTEWISGIFHRRIKADADSVKSIDDWLNFLGAQDVETVFSSGTSGEFSFVPADAIDRELSRTANINYLSPLLARREIGLPRRGKVVGMLPPSAYARIFASRGLPDFDAFFLGFRHGRLGNQALMQQLAPAFRRHHFLFDFGLPASTLRTIRRGPRNQDEYEAVACFQKPMAAQSGEYFQHFLDSLRASTEEGQKAFIFGTPFQFKQLMEAASGSRISLKPGSILLYGGGWKSFSGEVVPREDLVRTLCDGLGLQPEYILEGYSMTEISTLMLRCIHGSFHIPPMIEPVILDEELKPLRDNSSAGIFGFLDTLTVSRPGFIISGDYVHVSTGTCSCGLAGPAITEISRVGPREIKGCGGAMSAIAA
jgi:hypothetical protein